MAVSFEASSTAGLDTKNLVRVIDIAHGEVIARSRWGWSLALRSARGAAASSSADLDDAAVRVFAASPERRCWHSPGTTVASAAWPGARTAGGSPQPRRRYGPDLAGENRGAPVHVRRSYTTVQGVSWSPDSALLATASEDGTARILRVDDEGLHELGSLAAAGTSGGLISVAFSPDGGRLMTGDTAVTEVNVWDVTATAGAEQINAANQVMMATGAITIPWGAADFLPDSRGVVVGSGNAGSMLDVDTARLTTTIGSVSEFDVRALDVSPDGELIAVNGWDRPVHVWNAATGTQIFTIDGEGYDWTSDLGWSGDGERLAIAFVGSDRSVVLIVDRTGTEIGTIHPEPGFEFDSVDLSPDGRLAVVSTSRLDRQDPTTVEVQIWDSETVRSCGPSRRRRSPPSSIPRVAESPPASGTKGSSRRGTCRPVLGWRRQALRP